VPVAGPTEVSAVAGAVNELADALAHSEERQRLFLLSVSHELRTPLTAVRGFAESLADGVVTGNDATDAGRVIVREADRLDRLVGDLMELARLEADDFRLDPVPVDLAALAADAAPVWAARCADADVRFALQAAPTAVVRADPRRLRQVVDGLAENALRVTPRGAPLVVATGGDHTASWLQVRDGGPGFAPEDYPVVFERGVLGRTRAGAGAGRAHGGDGRRRTRARGRGLLHRHVPGRRPHRQAVNCTIRIALPKGSRRPKSVP
jgi:signal transduction histidine kinase